MATPPPFSSLHSGWKFAISQKNLYQIINMGLTDIQAKY